MSNEKVRYELKKVPLGRLVSKEFVISVIFNKFIRSSVRPDSYREFL